MIKYIQNKYNGKSLIGVEIGVDKGYNLKNIIDVLKPYQMYAVDITFKNLVYMDKKTNYIKKPSMDAKEFIPNSLDFVYIDGDHSYDMVYNDIVNYYPKVKKDGIIGGHDFKFFSVRRAVYRFFDVKDVFVEGCDWWVVKK